MWSVLGGSARGVSHVRAGKECQDSHGWLVAGDDLVCLAVADGAGSRDRSAEGSESAVDAVLGWAQRLDGGSEPDLRAAFGAARERVRAEAERLGVAELDLATTLAVVLISGGRVHVGQIGDSIVVVSSGDGLRAISPAPKGEYANETTFVTSAGAMDAIRLDVLAEEDVAAVALSTDGLRMKILDDLQTGAPYTPFFEDVFTYAASESVKETAVAAFIDGLADQTGDDKTLVVAVKTEAAGSGGGGDRVVLNDFVVGLDVTSPPAPDDRG